LKKGLVILSIPSAAMFPPVKKCFHNLIFIYQHLFPFCLCFFRNPCWRSQILSESVSLSSISWDHLDSKKSCKSDSLIFSSGWASDVICLNALFGSSWYNDCIDWAVIRLNLSLIFFLLLATRNVSSLIDFLFPLLMIQ
jgi:hypothetical protein